MACQKDACVLASWGKRGRVQSGRRRLLPCCCGRLAQRGRSSSGLLPSVSPPPGPSQDLSSVRSVSGDAGGDCVCALRCPADPRFPPVEVRPVLSGDTVGTTALGTPRADNAESCSFGGKRVFVNASSVPTMCACFKCYSKRDTHS